MNLSYFEEKFPHILKSVRSAKQNDKLAHSYIIYSDDTLLGKSLASVISKMIACEKDGLASPCNVCKNCTALERGIYPDFYKLEPLSKSRRILIGEDDSEQNTMRWFQSNFYYSSLSGISSRKIGIIYEADRIMPQAQNAFLKTLEEPPANSYFILCTDNPKVLLPTVISRCQKISLLTNRINYDFRYADDLFGSLKRIVTVEKAIPNAVNEIELLCKILSDIKNDSEKEITAEWNEKAQRSGESASNIKKYITPAKEAAISSEYMLRREKIINAVVTWFSLLYQLSFGIRHDSLSNPEIIDETIITDTNLDYKKTLVYLEYAEKFSWALKFNVDDTLAVHEFVMNAFFKI